MRCYKIKLYSGIPLKNFLLNYSTRDKINALLYDRQAPVKRSLKIYLKKMSVAEQDTMLRSCKGVLRGAQRHRLAHTLIGPSSEFPE